jgi:membrane-associated protease RseP (regulator of RpoE activity)
MPEKIEKPSQIHFEQEQLAQYSYDASESSENDYCEEEEEDEDYYERSEESGDEYDEELPDIGELLGFRITGGKDFFMPITIFHVRYLHTYCMHLWIIIHPQVKENSRAEKANLKLGDAILSINGRDTEDMTLVRANRYLAKVADGDVTLQVAK